MANSALLLILMGMMAMCSCSYSASLLLCFIRLGELPADLFTRSFGGSGLTLKQNKKTNARTSGSVQAPMPYEIPEGIKTDCPPGKRGVIGYKDVFRSGISYMWCRHDTGRGAGIKLIGNDKLSHLSVPRGMKVTAYEHNDMGGNYKIFSEGEWDLKDVNNNFDNGTATKVPNYSAIIHDRISSLKIEGTPPTAVTNNTMATYADQTRSGL